MTKLAVLGSPSRAIRVCGRPSPRTWERPLIVILNASDCSMRMPLEAVWRSETSFHARVTAFVEEGAIWMGRTGRAVRNLAQGSLGVDPGLALVRFSSPFLRPRHRAA